MEHYGASVREARDACIRMLERVRMPDPPAIMERYCHQLSGGQQQRVLIAMALLTNPALLIMDEPTTGLDVTVEAEILDLIGELKRELDTAILFISHSFGVISRVADRVAVMYAGELVEQASVRDIFLDPQHPYTVGLLGCVPKISAAGQRGALSPIRGRVPALHESLSGCVFESRCDRARERCRLEHPDIQRATDGHPVRCFFPESPGPAGLRPGPAAPAAVERPATADDPILNTEGLRVYYKARDRGFAGMAGKHKKGFVKAVDDVSLMADGKLHPGHRRRIRLRQDHSRQMHRRPGAAQ